MYTPISSITTALQSMPQAQFDAAMAGFMRELNPAIQGMNLAGLQTDQNAVASAVSAALATLAASDAASAAVAAALAANATKWVSGHAYGDGDVAWSLLDTFPYRRIGAGSGTVDPKLDGVNWSLQMYFIGMGGVQITGNITLTSTSPAAITATPSGYGLYASLPDATTCQKGVSLFSIYNAGVMDYGVKDFAGTTIGWVRPGTTAIIGLTNNSTAAGVWAAGSVEKVGVTAFLNAPSIQGSTLKRIDVDANRSLFLFGACYAAVYDSSSQLWGNPVLVRSITNGARASGILVGTDKVLVATCDSTTGIQSVVLSLTGTAIAVNSPVNSTAGSNVSQWGDFIAVGSGFAWSYTGASGSYVRVALVSGATPTIGNESTISGSAVLPVLFVSGTTLRAVGESGGLICRPYTLSGANLTPGTAATVASDGVFAQGYRVFQNGNGNIVAIYTSAGDASACVFKLTGTTEAASSAQFSAAISNAANVDYVQISGTKTAFIGWSASVVYWSIHVDTSGTSSFGTADSLSFTNGVQAAAIGVSGSSARFVVYDGNDLFAPMQLQFDCSGTSPVRGNSQVRRGINVPQKSFSGKAPRHFSLLSAGSNQYAIGGTHALDGSFNASNIQAIPSLGENYITGALGATTSESWLLSGYSGTGALGTTIKRIEAAA